MNCFISHSIWNGEPVLAVEHEGERTELSLKELKQALEGLDNE